MKPLSEKQALAKLRNLKAEFRALVKRDYEHRAADCQTCPTPGACCLDAHFVNVHITRLEAVLIVQELRRFSPEKRAEINRRIDEAIEKYDLTADGDTLAKTFACPLFEKGVGCLIHAVKPVPCIAHACYERREDLPPDQLPTQAEEKIERLNARVYKEFPRWLSLPVFLKLIERA